MVAYWICLSFIDSSITSAKYLGSIHSNCGETGMVETKIFVVFLGALTVDTEKTEIACFHQSALTGGLFLDKESDEISVFMACVNEIFGIFNCTMSKRNRVRIF